MNLLLMNSCHNEANTLFYLIRMEDDRWCDKGSPRQPFYICRPDVTTSPTRNIIITTESYRICLLLRQLQAWWPV